MNKSDDRPVEMSPNLSDEEQSDLDAVWTEIANKRRQSRVRTPVSEIIEQRIKAWESYP